MSFTYTQFFLNLMVYVNIISHSLFYAKLPHCGMTCLRSWLRGSYYPPTILTKVTPTRINLLKLYLSNMQNITFKKALIKPNKNRIPQRINCNVIPITTLITGYTPLPSSTNSQLPFKLPELVSKSPQDAGMFFPEAQPTPERHTAIETTINKNRRPPDIISNLLHQELSEIPIKAINYTIIGP